MPLLDIITFPDPVLRKRALPISRIDHQIRSLIDQIILTMYTAPGIGLAAPQVGVSGRIFVVDISYGRDPSQLLVLINPEIVSMVDETVETEGCLSVPGFQEKVARAAQVEIKGLDRKGNEVFYQGEGLLARAFQHEMDHLEGKLFFDRLGKIKRDLLKSKLKKKALKV